MNSSPAPPRLSLSGIRKYFGATKALDGVDLDVGAGEVHAIIGENGAGKSTLVKILSGAHGPDSGEIRIDGQRLDISDPRDAKAAGIVMIYQELTLAPDLSVLENITLGREPSRAGWINRSAQREAAREALSCLHHLDIPLEQPVRELSVAQQQMVELARAVQRPHRDDTPLRLLILDEPTSSLTQMDVKKLFSVVDRLKKNGVSILYISHFLEECEQVADRFTVLRDGLSIGSGNIKTTPMTEIIRMMVGRDISELYPDVKREPGEILLETKHVHGVHLPQDVTLSVRRGEIFGLAGLVGGGRTETARTVFGLDRMAKGCIYVHGKDAGERSPQSSWHRDRIGIVSEDRKDEGLLLTRSIIENLTITSTQRYCSNYMLKQRKMRATTREWMEVLDVKASSPDQPAGELSGGNQQKIAFGRLLHHECEILILDEPTRGIDIGSKATIYRAIGKLAASGKAILLISSYLPELLGICDTIGVMSRGHLVAVKPRHEWDEDSLLAAAIGQPMTSPT